MFEVISIEPYQQAGSHRTGKLSGITADEISTVLGFEPNIKDDPDKVVNSWGALVEMEDGKTYDIGIWDYKGSHHYNSFSTFGPDEVFMSLFPHNYC